MSSKPKMTELRLTAVENSQFGQVLAYLLRSLRMIGDGKAEAIKTLTAFWLPAALQDAGADPAQIQQVAESCCLVLEQQIYAIRQIAGLGPLQPIPNGSLVSPSHQQRLTIGNRSGAVASSSPDQEDEEWGDDSLLLDDE